MRVKRISLSVIGVVLAVLCFGIVVAGCCGNSSSTISLSEAREIVLNALAVDNAESMAVRTADVGNRNIFTKFGTAKLSLESGADVGVKLSGLATKTNDEWTEYLITDASGAQEYYDGSIAYLKNNDGYFNNTIDCSFMGVYLYSYDSIFLNLLFIDDAWDTIYGNEVEKIDVDGGYTLTMDIDMSKYVDFVMEKSQEFGLGAEGLFGEDDVLERNKTEGSASLVMTFTNDNEITKLDLAVSSLGFNGSDYSFVDTKISVSATTEEIVEPDWVSEI